MTNYFSSRIACMATCLFWMVVSVILVIGCAGQMANWVPEKNFRATALIQECLDFPQVVKHYGKLSYEYQRDANDIPGSGDIPGKWIKVLTSDGKEIYEKKYGDYPSDYFFSSIMGGLDLNYAVCDELLLHLVKRMDENDQLDLFSTLRQKQGEYILTKTRLIDVIDDDTKLAQIADGMDYVTFLSHVTSKNVRSPEYLKGTLEVIFRGNAVQKIKDQSVINELAKNARAYPTRIKAIERVTDKNLLKDLEKTDPNKKIRQKAALRLKSL